MPTTFAKLLLAATVILAGCSSGQSDAPDDGAGGSAGGSGGKVTATGGRGGGAGGSGGASAGGGSGGSGGGGGGAGGQNQGGASAGSTGDAGPTNDSGDAGTGTTNDATVTPSGDAPPAAMRPDAMGQACKSAANEAFTVTAFDPPQTGVFTAWFSVTPSIAPTNSVVGLSDGDVGPGSGNTPLHNLHQILIRFAQAGTLDARNGATYSADSVIKYEAIQYDFRVVVDLPNKKYAVYVSSKGQPEITVGTNLAYRDSAAVPTKFDHWAVQSVAQKTTVCDFIARAN